MVISDGCMYVSRRYSSKFMTSVTVFDPGITFLGSSLPVE
jgi:hypothetical protein